MSKLAIIGSRGFTNQPLAEEVFRAYCCEFNETTHARTYESYRSRFDEIVSGGARGADEIGANIAHTWGLKLTEFIPDWEKHGKRAGFLRNEDIVKSADMVLAFWDGVSKGTQSSLSIAKRLKKPTLIIYV